MLIFAFYFVSKKYEESVDYMLVVSLNMFLAFSFSGNYRQTLVSDNNKNLCNKVLVKRILFSPIILFLSFLISFSFLKIENLYVIFLGSFVVITIWINEISLILIEIKKKYDYLLYKTLFLYFSLLIIFFCFFFLGNNLIILLVIVYFFLFLILNFDFKIKDFYLKETKYVIGLNYISSIAINLSSFIFRYEINYYLDTKSASLMLFCITVGSSLSTITFNSLGPKDFNHTTKLSRHFKLLLLLYLFACLVTFFLIYEEFIFTDQIFSLKYALMVSIIGGLIFTISYIFRQNIISKKLYRNVVFFLDIILSIVVAISVPLLFSFGEYFLIYAYFFTSCSSLILYFYFYNYAVKKEFR